MHPKIDVRSVEKVYPSEQGLIHALEDINLTVVDGEFLCILGPSGCGKSTLLRILAGLNQQSAGEVIVHTVQNGHRPQNAVVFQEYAIFPWRTVKDNVSFGLEMRGVSKVGRETRTAQYLAKVGLTQFAEHYPYQLSGGMKQRVALARAMATDPEVLLMDEPFGALDAQTRSVLQEELLRIWEDEKKTVVYVTHSIEEAIILGDRVVLMTARPGRVKNIYLVDLPRPRHLDVRLTPEYIQLAQTLWEDLVEEVSKVMLVNGGGNGSSKK
jgi:NitT/TauT family transport system ATP-binding protein